MTYIVLLYSSKLFYVNIGLIYLVFINIRNIAWQPLACCLRHERGLVETLLQNDSETKIDFISFIYFYAMLTGDMVMNSRYMGYPLLLKCTAIIPSFVAVAFFVTVISLYGRFPEDQVRFCVKTFFYKVIYPKFYFDLTLSCFLYQFDQQYQFDQFDISLEISLIIVPLMKN